MEANLPNIQVQLQNIIGQSMCFYGEEQSAMPIDTYLIFVSFFTRAKFLENKIYTKKRQFSALNL